MGTCGTQSGNELGELFVPEQRPQRDVGEHGVERDLKPDAVPVLTDQTHDGNVWDDADCDAGDGSSMERVLLTAPHSCPATQT